MFKKIIFVFMLMSVAVSSYAQAPFKLINKSNHPIRMIVASETLNKFFDESTKRIMSDSSADETLGEYARHLYSYP